MNECANPGCSNPVGDRRADALYCGDEGATTRALCQPNVGGVRFSARIMELREAGLTITCVRERQGSSRYWLIADELERAA